MKIEESRNMLFVAEEAGDIKVYDFTNHEQLLLLTKYQLHSPINTIAISGDLLFVAHHNNMLAIYNIVNPQQPAYLTSLNLPAKIHDLLTSENLIFAAASYNGIYIINFFNPESPQIVANLATGGFACGLFYDENYLYVANGWEGLRIVDVHDPFEPFIAGEYQTPGFTAAVFVQLNKALIAKGTDGFEILDISRPASPSLLYRDPSQPAFWFSCYGSIALIYGNEIRFIDISQPTAPRLLGIFDMFANIYYARITNALPATNLAVSLKNKGWAVIQIDNFNSILPIASLNTGDYVYSVDIYPDLPGEQADLAYLGTGATGINIINVAEPGIPFLIGRNSSFGAWNAKVLDASLFLTDIRGGLVELTLTNPFYPAYKNRYWAHSGNVLNFWGDRNRLFLACGYFGLKIIDRNSLSLISITERDDIVVIAGDVVVSGDIAYLIDEFSGLLIYDISDPEYPFLLNQIDLLRGHRGKISGNYLYVACGEYGIFIFDIANPATPALAGKCQTFFARDVVVLNEAIALVADGNAGLCVLNIENKRNPRIINRYRFSKYESLESIAVKENRAYLGYGKAGLLILPLDNLLPPTSTNPAIWTLYY